MQHNHIKIQIAGTESDSFDVRFDDFIKKMSAIKRALTETDRLISSEQSVYYRIVDLTHSSPAAVEIEIVPRDSRFDNSELIAETFYTGIRMIQEAHDAPPIFDGQALRAFRDLTPLPSEKITDLQIFRNGDSVSVHSTLTANIDSILGPDQYESGSVTGRMEAINIHAGQNVFTIYPTLEGYKLRCVFTTQLKELAVAAVNRNVTVYGRMKFKTRDTHPYEMSVKDIEVHSLVEELPTLGELRGVAPNATGGMRSEDFVRKIRDDWG